MRTLLGVPLVKDGRLVGSIAVYRREVQPFTDQQTALLQTFANQAVIAIENVRLFNETKEALEQQTATAEILRVISSSPTDVQPVFDALVSTGARLCEADYGFLARYDGTSMAIAAHSGATDEEIEAVVRVYPMVPTPDTLGGRTILDLTVVHIPDVRSDPTYGARVMQDAGWRTGLGVPLLREGAAIGLVGLWRRDVRPFSDRQIELLKIFAQQAVIASENVRLFTELQAKNRDLTTALDQQTATSEILRVISCSPTDVQPVFDAIVQSALRLLDGVGANVARVVGDELQLAAFTTTGEAGDSALGAAYPMPIGGWNVAARAVRARTPIYLIDTEIDSEYQAMGKGLTQARGVRSIVAVPMILQSSVVGTVAVSRREPGSFSDEEIAVLKTFADQAVIAIENVRLFKELQDSNRQLTVAHAQVSESLEQQTATSEILRAIASSPTEVQPVFDTILSRATILLGGFVASITRRVGDDVHMAAFTSMGESLDATVRQSYPVSIDSHNPHAVAIRLCEPHIIADADTQADIPEPVRRMARARGWRSNLAVPLRRAGTAIGALGVSRRDARGFTAEDVALLQTFADQAVIAVENVRLFTELAEKNRALTQAHGQVTEALERQTATSEILSVISSSPTDVQPVFDSLVASAARLCKANDVLLLIREGDALRPVAGVGAFWGSLAAAFRVPLARGSVAARSVIDGTTLHIPDLSVASEAEFSLGRDLQRRFGHRTVLAVPLSREGVALGAIFAMRFDVRPFEGQQIALLKTFADQGVIAIENVRLFTELQARTQELTRSVEQLTALREVGHAVSSSLDLETVLNTIVARAVQLAGAHSGTIWEYDTAAEEFALRITQNVEDPELRANPNARVRRGEGAVGRLAVSYRPVQIADITHEGAYEDRLRDSLVGAGTRGLLAIPLLHEDQLLGGLVISRRTPGEFSAEIVDLLASFATQSALALQNARLFLEIEHKRRQLEAASQHKSEFLANMSHELRTPLNAIIGFSEVLGERMFGELNEKQEEYLKDIHASGQHLLSLINDILDLSKIEAGRMELELADVDLPQAIQNAVILVRERALRHGLTLEQSIDPRLGEIRGDERKIKQVLLNLLSNAIKFTSEGGRVGVRAAPVGGNVEVAVSDTGVGIAPEHLEAVFEEFRQVGTAEKKAEGTGLGLALARRFVELHGGRIWVQSQVGAGSTFTFTIPMRTGV
jgi:GAF domain-containing protein